MAGISLSLYSTPDMKLWEGRVDGQAPRAALRWHQVVEPLDLTDSLVPPRPPERAFCFLGYRCDAGIDRNLGRPGAAAAPASIRRKMASLPVDFSPAIRLLDAGDIICNDTPVEQAQAALAAAVDRSMNMGLFPIILGGGHDLTFGHYLGVRRGLPADRTLGVVNFDAHFDLRSAKAGASSGTSFWQIARETEDTGRDFEYLCIGIQGAGNTVALFDRAQELGVEYVRARDVVEHRLEEVRATLDRFAQRVDSVMVTVDADVMSSAFAPGVSSPQPLGLDPETVARLLTHLLAQGNVVSLDVAEVSPRFDRDDNTAKVAAILIHTLIEALIPDEERILEG